MPCEINKTCRTLIARIAQTAYAVVRRTLTHERFEGRSSPKCVVQHQIHGAKTNTTSGLLIITSSTQTLKREHFRLLQYKHSMHMSKHVRALKIRSTAFDSRRAAASQPHNKRRTHLYEIRWIVQDQ